MDPVQIFFGIRVSSLQYPMKNYKRIPTNIGNQQGIQDY